MGWARRSSLASWSRLFKAIRTVACRIYRRILSAGSAASFVSILCVCYGSSPSTAPPSRHPPDCLLVTQIQPPSFCFMVPRISCSLPMHSLSFSPSLLASPISKIRISWRVGDILVLTLSCFRNADFSYLPLPFKRTNSLSSLWPFAISCWLPLPSSYLWQLETGTLRVAFLRDIQDKYHQLYRGRF